MKPSFKPNKTLTPLYVIIEGEIKNGMERYEAMQHVAKQLNTTLATLYRWLKDGDHYVSTEGDFHSVYKNVKTVEKG